MKLAVIEAFDAAGLDDVNAVGGLEAAFDEEKTFLRDGEAKFFEELRGDNGVGDAGFIFEADENETFRRSRPLPANNVASNANRLAMLPVRQIDGAPNFFEMPTEKTHRMRPNCQA